MSGNATGLVDERCEGATSAFFFWMLASVLILSLGWNSLAERFVVFKAPFSFTTNESNVALITKALLTRQAKVAIAGSSLALRLDPHLFPDADEVMNLSVGGGSVMTGLEILNHAAHVPPVIIAEINILDRRMDAEVESKGACVATLRSWAMLCGALKPFRYLLMRPAFSYRASDDWKLRRDRLRSQNANMYDIDTLVSTALRMWDERNFWDVADENWMRLQELIPRLEAKGSKVYFMYLPFPEKVDAHPFARRNREIAGGTDAFDCPRCLDVRKLVDVRELRWKDPAHLDDRSALIVADALARKFLH